MRAMVDSPLPEPGDVRVSALSPHQFQLAAPVLVDIYLAAMDYQRSLRSSRVAAWRQQAAHPGFRAVIGHDRDTVLGFAYAFQGSAERWWHRHVADGLRRAAGAAAAGRFLTDYLELAEVHVDPRFQSRGLGRRLVRAVTDAAPQPRVVLSTPEVPGEDNNAFRAYRALGFYDLMRGLVFPSDSRPFAVLAADLPLPAEDLRR